MKTMDTSAVCGHCGGTPEGYATIGSIRVCHPDDPGLPDCYRRVTAYREPLGILRHLPDRPAGIEHITDPWDLYLDCATPLRYDDVGPAVCRTHLRFAPCRRRDGRCVISVDPGDIARTRAYQQP